MPSPEDDLRWLEGWYASQCNSTWEHSRGITIETLDNPGWLLTVDLAETSLEARQMSPVRLRAADNDWMEYEIVDGQFRAAGDAGKLAALIHAFREFAEASSLLS